jgi:hypothetical protein
VKIIFQTVEDLHIACPKILGIGISQEIIHTGGNRVVNKAFMNFYEGKTLELIKKKVICFFMVLLVCSSCI